MPDRISRAHIGRLAVRFKNLAQEFTSRTEDAMPFRAVDRRNALGGRPNFSLNALLKCDRSWNPHSNMSSVTLNRVVCKSETERVRRRSSSHLPGDVP